MKSSSYLIIFILIQLDFVHKNNLHSCYISAYM